MELIGADHPPHRKPNEITKANREVRKADDLLKRDFSVEMPLEKCVTDIISFLLKMENYMFQRCLTALTRWLWNLQWTIICAPNYVSEHLRTHAEVIWKCVPQ